MATNVADRARWQRDQSVRWDERRLAAYADYANAVKEMVIVADCIAAGWGLTPFPEALAGDAAGLGALAGAEARRNTLIETVRLLADSATMNAIRELNSRAWRLEALARGNIEGNSQAWKTSYDAYMEARDGFIKCARGSLRVHGSVTPRSPHSPPWKVTPPREASGHHGRGPVNARDQLSSQPTSTASPHISNMYCR